MNGQTQQLLTEIGIGRISPSAYDTAWVARLQPQMPELAGAALQWLRENQLPDGSWGASEFFNYHDRMVCTLSATIALQQADDPKDVNRLKTALGFLEKNGHKINLSPIGATVGYEMIVPTLLQEITDCHGIMSANKGNGATKAAARQKKLENIPSRMITRHTTIAHSAEMVGTDNQHVINWEHLLEDNGSVGFSPAATAYFVNHYPENDRAKSHLESVFLDASVPNVSCVDLFETIWTLWNFQQAYPDLGLLRIKEHLDFIESSWVTGLGTSFASGYTPKDGDDSSLAYEVLVRGGRTPDLGAILHYEEADVFRCFQNESDPSISTNIHVIGALRQAGYKSTDPSVQKVTRYLQGEQHPEGWWLDKWHASPYYPSSHYVITATGYCEDAMVQRAVDWMINTQNKDGSWGYIIPTAEETAYSLMALAHYKRAGYPVDKKILQRGKIWLADHSNETSTPLWIGKCLYSPARVVASTILSALVMVDDC
jgi:halimadienyl-diphosphate synthase